MNDNTNTTANTILANSLLQTKINIEKTINSLVNLIDIAVEHIIANDLNEEEFLASRIAPDMFDLKKQIQLCSDSTKGFMLRVCGVDAPAYKDDEVSFEELKSRLIVMLSALKTVTIDNLQDKGDLEIVLPWMQFAAPETHLKVGEYLNSFFIPNFYFHIVAVYMIMRNKGVKIGKMDYIAKLDFTQNV